jgi:hypothetical protein
VLPGTTSQLTVELKDNCIQASSYGTLVSLKKVSLKGYFWKKLKNTSIMGTKYPKKKSEVNEG